VLPRLLVWKFACAIAMPGQYSSDPVKHTLQPIVTGSSVIALKYKDGVMMVADELLSYGKSARYMGFRRIEPVGKATIIGASGEFSDFQYIRKLLDQEELDDFYAEDGSDKGARQYGEYLGRVMYNRRSKFNPLYNQIVIGGFQDTKVGEDRSEPYLAYIDNVGTTFEDNFIATGFGGHLSIPMLRKSWHEDMSANDASQLLSDCLRVLYARDCRAFNRFTRATCTRDGGVQIEEGQKIEANWDVAFFNEKTIGSAGASW